MSRFKRYRLTQKPPSTEQERRAARDKQLLDQADKLFFTHARPLLLLCLPTAAAPPLLGLFLPTLAAQGVSLALILLLGPLLLLGFAGLCLRAWRGHSLKPRDAFEFCRREHLPAAWAFSALWLAATQLPWLAQAWLVQVADLPQTGLIGASLSPLVWLHPVLTVVGVWLFLRLAPAPFLFILGRAGGQETVGPGAARAALAESWSLQKGEMGGLIRYALRLFFRTLPLIALVFLLPLLLVFFGFPAIAEPAFLILTAALRLLAIPLITLSLLGFFDRRLPTSTQARRKK